MSTKKTKKIKKHAGGRPTRMTKDTLDKLKVAFLAGLNDEEACIYAQIKSSTLYKYQRKHPQFIKYKESWKKNPVLKAKLTVFNNLTDPKTAQWYLERKVREEFGNRLNLPPGLENVEIIFHSSLKQKNE